MFKNKYLIGVYTTEHEGETLLSLCEDSYEFADYLQTSVNSARAILSKLYLGKQKYIVVDNKLRIVEFIEGEEE